MSKISPLVLSVLFALFTCYEAATLAQDVKSFDYPYSAYNEGKLDPQATGWPLTSAERSYVLKPDYERRPGSEVNKHLPKFWPQVPSAGFWGGTSWLDTHTKLVDYVSSNKGKVDVLLVGDSITQQWGSPLDNGSRKDYWKANFPTYRSINIGIGGDRIQHVLWRLEHGGVDGLEPKVVVLMIGNNNMFFTPETGVDAVAEGVQVCVKKLRHRFPKAEIIVTDILPAHAPKIRFYEDIKETNRAVDTLKLDSDKHVHRLLLWKEFVQADGMLKPELFVTDKIHLSEAGYALWASRLKPLLDPLLAKSGQ